MENILKKDNLSIKQYYKIYIFYNIVWQIYELIISCEEGWSELSIGLAWGPVAGSKIFCKFMSW